jgi:hypothetical protein
MADHRDDVPYNSPVLHELQNHLAIIVGFCDLLLADLPQSDRVCEDIGHIRAAGKAAMDLLPDVAARMRSSL